MLSQTDSVMHKKIKCLYKSLEELNRVATYDANSIDDFLEMETHNVFHHYIRLIVATIRNYGEIIHSEYREDFYKHYEDLANNVVLQEMLVHHYDPKQEMTEEEINRRRRDLQWGISLFMKRMKQDLREAPLSYKSPVVLCDVLKVLRK